MSAGKDSAIIVIQCAAGKQSRAGRLQLRDGRAVRFIARPKEAPQSAPYAYAHPDDIADTGESWREMLLRYNLQHQDAPAANLLGLLPAWQLYKHPVYARLVNTYGCERLYILSAGWGLIRADFLTPDYDITFSSQAESYQRRRSRDTCQDWNMLPDAAANPVVFFGGKDYVSLFCSLTAPVTGARYVFYNSRTEPATPGCRLIKYNTRTRTNWHYQCAQAFMDGEIGI